MSFLAGNGEVTATDDGGIGGGLAGAFDLGGVAGIELQFTEGAVSLAEFNRNDGGASVKDELTDNLGFGLGKQDAGHGKKEVRSSCPVAHHCAHGTSHLATP